MLAVFASEILPCGAAQHTGQLAACRFARCLTSRIIRPSRCLQSPSALARQLHTHREGLRGLGIYSGSRRGLFHVPAMAWGAAKLGAVVSGFVTKKHMMGAVAKWLTEQWTSGKALQSLRDLNDKLLASNAQSKESHEAMAANLTNLEKQLLCVAEHERIRILQEWLAEAERRTPELVVALAKAYADNFKGVKAAKALAKGLPTHSPDLVAGQPPSEWEQRIHAAFPELKGFSVVLQPKHNEEFEEKHKGDNPSVS